MKVVTYKITSHTGDDDKDEGNGVVTALYRNNDVIFENPAWHQDLTFRNGDDNTWSPNVKKDFDTTESANAKFVVSMTGDKGNWKSAFSIVGILPDGTEYRLLSRTDEKTFYSGQNSTYEFRLTSVSLRSTIKLV